jgi:hypothetical protein
MPYFVVIMNDSLTVCLSATVCRSRPRLSHSFSSCDYKFRPNPSSMHIVYSDNREDHCAGINQRGVLNVLLASVGASFNLSVAVIEYIPHSS